MVTRRRCPSPFACSGRGARRPRAASPPSPRRQRESCAARSHPRQGHPAPSPRVGAARVAQSLARNTEFEDGPVAAAAPAPARRTGTHPAHPGVEADRARARRRRAFTPPSRTRAGVPARRMPPTGRPHNSTQHAFWGAEGDTSARRGGGRARLRAGSGRGPSACGGRRSPRRARVVMPWLGGPPLRGRKGAPRRERGRAVRELTPRSLS